MAKLSEIAGVYPTHDVPNGHPGEEEPLLPAKPATVAARTIKWDKPVVMIGCGCVWECTFPILIKHLGLKLSQVTLIDMLDRRDVLANWIKGGAKFYQEQILPENFEDIMEKYVPDGSLVVELSYDIDIIEILDWCREHNCLYINTSTEQWNFKENITEKSAWEKSLHYRKTEVDEVFDTYTDGPTACIDHGANPGLISHFMKRGLLDLAKAKGFQFEGNYAKLARKMGIKVALDTERDTQRCVDTRKVGEFVGTWSCMGLYEEATAPAELGWGNHENEPEVDYSEPEDGENNQIFLHQCGMDTRVLGFVPTDPKAEVVEKGEKDTSQVSSGPKGQQIQGVLIRHAEAYSISKFLTDGAYKPTSYYCYQPCDSTVASLQELRANDYKMLPHQRIVYDDDIIDGSDTLGIMLGGYSDDKVWWCGTSLNIEDARKLVPLQNATSIQVAISIVAACMYMIENPNLGVLDPEDVDTDYILEIAKPYLGTFISKEFTWNPIMHHTVLFPEHDKLDKKNIWSFNNFLIQQ